MKPAVVTYVPPLPGRSFDWNIVPMHDSRGFVYFALHRSLPTMALAGPQGWQVLP